MGPTVSKSYPGISLTLIRLHQPFEFPHAAFRVGWRWVRVVEIPRRVEEIPVRVEKSLNPHLYPPNTPTSGSRPSILKVTFVG